MKKMYFFKHFVLIVALHGSVANATDGLAARFMEALYSAPTCRQLSGGNGYVSAISKQIKNNNWTVPAIVGGTAATAAAIIAGIYYWMKPKAENHARPLVTQFNFIPVVNQPLAVPNQVQNMAALPQKHNQNKQSCVTQQKNIATFLEHYKLAKDRHELTQKIKTQYDDYVANHANTIGVIEIADQSHELKRYNEEIESKVKDLALQYKKAIESIERELNNAAQSIQHTHDDGANSFIARLRTKQNGIANNYHEKLKALYVTLGVVEEDIAHYNALYASHCEQLLHPKKKVIAKTVSEDPLYTLEDYRGVDRWTYRVDGVVNVL